MDNFGLLVLQAVGALGAAFFAGLLWWVTRQYVRITQDQLGELKRARLTTLQPHVHVTGVSLGRRRVDDAIILSPPDPLHEVLTGISLKNIGPGPALSMRAFAYHPTLGLQPQLGPTDVGAGGLETIILPLNRGGLTDTPGLTNEIWIWIEYRDLFGRLWRTTNLARLALVFTGGVGNTCNGVFLVDALEKVEQVSRHSIRQHDSLGSLQELIATVSRPAVVSASDPGLTRRGGFRQLLSLGRKRS